MSLNEQQRRHLFITLRLLEEALSSARGGGRSSRGCLLGKHRLPACRC